MSTASSALQPPTILARAAFVDPTTGVLTKEAFWFLYQLFKAAFGAEGSSTVLDFIDSGADVSSSLAPRIEDLERLFALEEQAQSAPISTTPTGPAGGDLSGNYPNPTVVGLDSNPLSPIAPTLHQVLEWDGAHWTPTTLPVSPGAAIIDYHTISGATTITPSVYPAPTNGLLIVFLTFSSATQPGWSSDFSLAPGALATKTGTRSIIMFCADGAGKWAMCAPPVSGL